jgi:hypothetical protein
LPEKNQLQVNFRLVVMASNWQLLTGGRYSEVVVRTGLNVCKQYFTILGLSDHLSPVLSANGTQNKKIIIFSLIKP